MEGDSHLPSGAIGPSSSWPRSHREHRGENRNPYSCTGPGALLKVESRGGQQPDVFVGLVNPLQAWPLSPVESGRTCRKHGTWACPRGHIPRMTTPSPHSVCSEQSLPRGTPGFMQIQSRKSPFPLNPPVLRSHPLQSHIEKRKG